MRFEHEEMNKLLEAGYGDSAELIDWIWSNKHPDWTIENVIEYAKEMCSTDVVSILEVITMTEPATESSKLKYKDLYKEGFISEHAYNYIMKQLEA